MRGAMMGFDIGNTNIKCIVLDAVGNVLGLSKMPSRIRKTTACGLGHFDGHALMDAIEALCSDALAQTGGAQIKGLAVAGMGSAGLLLCENGNIIPPPILEGFFDPMPGLADDEYFRTCGYPKTYQNGGVYLAKLSRQRPDLFAAVRACVSISDYVAYRLTNALARDISTAGSFSLVDINTGGNWTAFLEKNRISESILPPIVQSGAFIGEVQKNACLPPGTPVFAGGHDYLCAAFAAGCINEGDAINVLGTYEMMACFYAKPKMPPQNSGILSFMDSHVYPGLFACTTESECGSSINRALALGEKSGISSAGMFKALDENGDESSELARAIIKINKTSQSMLKVHKEASGRGDLRIRVVGGGSKSRYYMQNKSDIMGAALYVPTIPEATAAGAALLAGYGCGIFRSYDEASQLLERQKGTMFFPSQT